MPRPIFKSAFQSPFDEFDGGGKRPVVFDIIGPDRVMSLLPPFLKLVLHVNPTSMQFTYAKTISRQQTLAGYVEYHWGSNPTEIAFNMASGGFVRLHTGLSYTTGPTVSNDKLPPNMQAKSTGGTRRETIAYDKYLDMLALFHNNGAIYDTRGAIAFQGQILVTYDGGSWWGWFTSFSVEEAAEKPYQFTLSANFTVERELHRVKSVYIPLDTTRTPNPTGNIKPDGSAETVEQARVRVMAVTETQTVANQAAAQATGARDTDAWLENPGTTYTNADIAVPSPAPRHR